jgi:hypothetical protein
VGKLYTVNIWHIFIMYLVYVQHHMYTIVDTRVELGLLGKDERFLAIQLPFQFIMKDVKEYMQLH